MREQENKYTILEAHDRTDGSHKSLEELEIEYVNLTDELIYHITHGFNAIVDGKMTAVVPTKVIFLDKSARPLAWLTRDLWDKLAPEPGETEIPKQPDFNFLNIDRRQWRDQLDPNKTGQFNADNLSDSQMEGLRSIFNRDHNGSFDETNDLDDQVILVVDEVKSTGDTLNIAQEMIKRAFPSSIVGGVHWMSKTTQVNGATGNADIPIWYQDDSKDPKNEVGRGVGNRLPKRLITHPSQEFLSRRFNEPDQKALRLREDFKTLSDGVGNDVLYQPYTFRDDESIEKRTEKYNQLSYRETMLARRAISESNKQLASR
ncbi:MAG TPA: hypothetical protein VF281_02290 [Candidatus Saccharimonadales bacterium]